MHRHCHIPLALGAVSQPSWGHMGASKVVWGQTPLGV